MSERYQHISSPLKIRKMTLKSRFLYPCAQPHFLAGPELYPSNTLMSYYERIARNGAALIIVHDVANDYQRSIPGFDIPHFAMWNINDPGCQNYFAQFANVLRCYGSVICSSMNVDMEVNWTVDDPTRPGGMEAMGVNMLHGMDEYGDMYQMGSLVGPEPQMKVEHLGAPPDARKQFTAETVQEYIKIYADRCKKYQSLGFNAGLINLQSYIGQFFHPALNHRTDEYGGSYENRVRFLHEFLGGLRKAVGNDYLLVCNLMLGGVWDIETAAQLCKEAAPYIDILHIRDMNNEIGTREECENPVAANYSAQLKALGVTTPIAVNTPYMDLDSLEDIIASGKADLISSNHMFMCNNHINDIMNEGNGEDLEPCLLCHSCRGLSWTGTWISRCTINPVMGYEDRLDKMTVPVESPKRVAIIGGGPGAMRCALYLKERGHIPEIFEKSDVLGGQLAHEDQCDFKWRMARYIQWLRDQLVKKGVTVHLNTEATPEMIKAQKFDAVVAATGATPQLPDVPGAENAGKWNVANIYGNTEKLGKRVVIVGGASAAAEAGIYLARTGHEVTMICRKNIIAYDLNPIRQRGLYNRYAHQNGVQIKKNSTTLEITADSVRYADAEGVEHTVAYDDIIATGGMDPNRDAAIAFHGAANQFYMIGDCKQSQNLRLAIRDAYTVANQIR